MPRFEVTPRAAAEIAAIAERQGKPGAALRVSVSAGGCSGMQYGFDLAEAPEMDDLVVEQSGVRVLVDLAAQTHEPLVRWIDDSGVLNMADDTGFTLHYWHVMDSGRDSVDLLTRLLDRYGDKLNYVLVLNQLRGDDFGQLERSGQLERALGLGAKVISLKHLADAVVQKIDANNSSFWAARSDTSGGDASLRLMERQRLAMWLQHAYEELAKAEA